jgi:hypothetical protein
MFQPSAMPEASDERLAAGAQWVSLACRFPPQRSDDRGTYAQWRVCEGLEHGLCQAVVCVTRGVTGNNTARSPLSQVCQGPAYMLFSGDTPI